MKSQPPATESSSALEDHLETALEHAEDDTVRYHLRESLQMVYGQNDT